MSRKVKVCLALFLSFAVLAQYSFTPQAMVAYGMDNSGEVTAAQAEESSSDSGQSSEKQEATKPAPEPTKATEAPAPTSAPAATTESTQATESTEATTVPEEQSDDVEDENDVNTGDPIAGEDPAAEEEEAAEEDEEEEWEHSFSGSCNGLTVKVSAPDGAFKKGTKMNLSAISDATAASIVSSVLPENKEVTDVVGVDISFSYKGSKDQPNESVKVSISGASLEGSNPVLYHKHGGAIEQSGASNNGASISTGAFSPFILATSADGEEETWKANFRNRDGEIIETRDVVKGEEIGELPGTIPREDYNAYWAIGTHQGGDQGGSWVAGDRISSSYVPESDVDIIPDYDKITHTVSFYESEEATEAIATRTVDVDTSYCLNDIPSVPHKEGYTGKWVYSGGDFNNNVQIQNDTKVWAEYEKTVFTVTYEYKLSGQDVKVYQTDKYYKGDTLTLPSDPVEEGHEFIGWYDGDTKYTGGEEVTSDLTLQGEFTDMYFVKFVVLNDDETVKETLTQYFRTEGDKIETMPQNPFVAGKQFNKWVIQGTETEVTADTVVNEDIVAVAVFDTIEKYTITAKYWYQGNSGKVVVDSAIIEVADENLPYTITPPATIQTDPDEVTGGPIYYPTKTSVTVTKDDFNEDNEYLVEIEYVEYTAEYDFVYLLKDLTGDGYSEIGREADVKGVLGSFVTPTVRDYDYADLEVAEGATIEKAKGQELNVKYTRKNFQLTYETNGGSYVAGTTAPYGSEVALSSTVPTKDGYTFDGWYLDETCTQAAGSSVTLEKDTTVYAKWAGKEVNYTIVYMFEKYNDAGTSSSYVYDNSRAGVGTVGTTVQANSAPTITRTGWEKDAEKNATSSVVIAADGSSVLFVYYKLHEYTISFNRNGGTIVKPDGSTANSYSFKAKLGQDISTLWPSARANGTQFTGWTKNGVGSGSLYVTKQLIMNDGLLNNGQNVTFYANWGPGTTVQINYYFENPNDSGYTKSDDYSQSVTASNSWGGYSFSAKTINGYTYDHGDSGKSNLSTYNFYYKRNTYKIDYYYGSTNLRTINNVKFDATITGSTYNWTPTAAQCGVDSDYTFDGWYSDSGLTTKYTFGKMPANNLVLYAKWTPPTFTVSFDVDGGTPQIDDQTVHKYEKAEKPANPTKEGYKFDGWYTSKDGGTLYDWANQITEDTTIYAHWTMEPLSYTVHYVDENNSPLAPDKTVTNPNFEVGQTITEQAVAIAGYRPDEGAKDVTLKVGTNEITFVYSEKSETTSYKVRYLLEGTNTPVADDKVVENVDGNTLSVIEFAVEASLDGQELYPDAAEKTLVLGADVEKNVLVFYYSKYKSVNITVNFVDMNGEQIADADTQTLKVGNTFTLSHTPIAGWELNRAVIGDDYSGTAAESSYKITEELATKYASGLEFTLFYQKKVTITAASFSKQYDGTPLTMPANISEQIIVEPEGVVVTGIDFTYAGADVAKGRLNAGVATVTPKNAVIDGNDATNGDYYKVRYISGTLEVTKINVTVRIEPDRWTGITYDGTLKKVGFTNGDKDVEDYILISHEGYSAEYLDDIWTAITNLSSVQHDEDAPGLGYYVVERKNVCDEEYDLGLTLANLPEDDNYSVSLYVRTGRVQILPVEATITTGSASKPYDGTPLTNDEAEIVGLVDADKDAVTITATGSQTEVGTSDNTYTIDWGEVSSDNYSITSEELGKLEVTSNDDEVTLTAASDSKTYDGTALTKNEVTESGLPDGFTVEATASGSQTDAGESANVVDDEYIIKNASGEDVTESFTNVKKVDGTLTVEKAPVTITTGTDSKTYDGTALTKDEASIEGLVNGETATVTATGSQTNAGESDNTYTIEWGTAKEDNYEVTEDLGTLTVEKAPLAITTESASKVYDGDPLTADGSISGLVKDETATFEVTGSQTDVGSSDNTYTLTWDGTAKEDNYEITSESIGKLTVTESEKEIVVTTTGGTFTYDGQAHGATVKVGELPKGYTLDTATSSATATDVTTTAVDATCDTLVILNAKGEDVTDKLNITYVDGTIEITPATLTITTPDAEKDYDGTPLTAEGTISGFVNGETATFKTTGSQTNAGSSKNTYTLTWDGSAKEGNYTLSETIGTLTVNKVSMTINVKGNNKETKYDGTFQTVEGYTLECSSDMYDAKKVQYSGGPVAVGGTDARTYNIGIDAQYFTYQDDNVSATFVVTDGKLVIAKRNVTVTSASDSKVYDGTALTNNGITISGDGFVDGETPAFRVTGSQTAVGSSKNTFDILPNSAQSSSILDLVTAEANEYKAENYNITKVYGTLTVTPATGPTPPPTPPTPTPTPDGGGNNPGGGGNPIVAANPIPAAAIGDTPTPTTINDEPAPRAATGFWALINLICAILTALLSLIMLIRYFGKRREEDEETGEVTEIKRKGGVKLASIIPAIGAIIAFILTEDMTLPMQLVDKWTLLMVIILAIQVLVAFFSRKKEEEEDQEDEGAMA